MSTQPSPLFRLLPGSRLSRVTAALLTIGIGLSTGSTTQTPKPPEAPKVLTLEAAAERVERFLDLLRRGKTDDLYAMLDDFTRSRYQPKEYAAYLAKLVAPYGKLTTIRVLRREAGSPFLHVYAEVEHQHARVLYHFTLSPEGQVVHFEVEQVNGEPVNPPAGDGKLATRDQAPPP